MTREQRHRLLHFFPLYVGPGRPQQVAYGLASIAMAVLELSDSASTHTLSYATLALTLSYAGLLAIAGVYAPRFEFAYVAAFFLGELGGLLGNISFPSLGIYIIAGSWFARAWTVPALSLLAANIALILFQLGLSFEGLASAALPNLVTLAVGFGLLWHSQRYELKEEEAETLGNTVTELEARVSSIEAKTRQALAADLHDTIAKDLAHMAIEARRLADNPGKVDAESLSKLAQAAASASKRIRPVILNLDAESRTATLEKTLEDSATLLASRSMQLAINTPPNLDSSLSHEAQALAVLVVREGATNMLKYAAPHSAAAIAAEIADGRLSLTLTNDIAPKGTRPVSPSITGGYGLANLADRLQRAGGTLEFAAVGGRWLLHALIPTEKGSPA